MQFSLDQINRLFIKLEPFFDLSLDSILNLSEENQRLFVEEKSTVYADYELAIELLRNSVPLLSKHDILTGYKEGCKLLQRGLSGYMCQQFDRLYLSTMIDAIERDEIHVAPHFLQAIADNLGQESISVVLSALNSKQASIKKVALSVCHQLNAAEAMPIIRGMTADQDKIIAHLALETLKWLENAC